MIITIPFSQWLPDHPDYLNAGDVEAKNVISTPGGYGPIKSLSAYSSALTAVARGAISIKDDDGNDHTFAGTATKLYKLQTALTWEDVTRTTGGDYSFASDASVRFIKFGDLIIALNGADANQKYDVSSSTDFAALGGSPPIAKYGAVVRDHLALANLINNGNKVQWSGQNDAEGWTAGTNLSDSQVLPEGGRIVGITGGQYGMVFQEHRVTQMTFVGGPLIFSFDTIEENRGCIAPGSIIRVGNRTYFIANDGFYAIGGGGGAIPVGAEKVSEWFMDDVDQSELSKITAGVDTERTLIFWSYVSTSSSLQVRDRMIIHNWVTGEWSRAEADVELLIQAYPVGFDLEGLDAFGDLDSLTESLDSSVWQGGAQRFGAFDTDHKLGYFDGANMEAIVTAAEQGDGNATRLITEIRPLVDSASMSVRAGSRSRLGDAVDWSSAASLNSRGVCPVRKNGRYLSAEVTITGDDWKRAQGVEAQVAPTGNR